MYQHSRVAALVALFPAILLLPGAFGQATINIQTQTALPLAPGFSGFNAPQPRNGVEYFDPKFMAAVTPLRPGWLRFPGGTVSLAYDWQTGYINTNWMNLLIGGNPPLVSPQTATILTLAQALTQAKGGVKLTDFATFAQSLGAPAIVCFNTYTDNLPNSAPRMALATHNYGLKVIEWELGNEAYFYPRIYPTAASYAEAVYPYFSGIRTALPIGWMGVPLAGTYPGVSGSYTTWDNGLSIVSPPGYSPHYWNAVSNHIYPITSTQSTQNTIYALNGLLAHASSDYVRTELVPLAGPDTPIFITEMNCCTQQTNPFLSYIYNGIFLAEYIARLSTVPNVKGVGINSLYTDNADYHGLLQSVDDFESYLLAQVAANPNYSTNTATNPNTQFQFYTSAPGLAMQVANQVINSSSTVWPTTVTGGLMVGIAGFDGKPIPSIYAQGYQTASGQEFALITNKAPGSQIVTIQVNGTPVAGPLNLTYVSNANAAAANSAQSPTTVQIQTAATGNPTRVGSYSVTAITW